MMRRLSLFLVAAALAVTTAAGAGEPGVVLKADEIKAEPFRDAKTVGSLGAGDKVDIVDKQGGWYQVTSGKGKGWVRMLSVRRGEARKGGEDASGVVGLATGRAGTGRVVATTGIRGLSEQELKAAKFNEAELKKAESYAVSRGDAQKFAADGKLAAKRVEYLPGQGR